MSPFLGSPLPEGQINMQQRDSNQWIETLQFEVELSWGKDAAKASGQATLNSNTPQYTTVNVSMPTGSTRDSLLQAPQPLNATLTGLLSSEDGRTNATYTAWANVMLVPPPESNSSASVVRFDSAGGFYVRNQSSKLFEPFFPYGYYASTRSSLFTNLSSAMGFLTEYAQGGLNTITPQQDVNPVPYEAMADDNSIVLFQHDLHESYTDLDKATKEACAVKNNKALFSYLTADNPDGEHTPFAAVVAARDAIRRIDPCHPVSIVLGCQNFYFDEYAAGADILIAEVFPIGFNAFWSTPLATPVNTTFGYCGCDNCLGDLYAVLDITYRLDNFAIFEAWNGHWPKPKLLNMQSFSGSALWACDPMPAGSYWARDPTPLESWAMALTAVNHCVRGILASALPGSPELIKAHGQLAHVLTTRLVLDFVVTSRTAPKVLSWSKSTKYKSRDSIDPVVWKGQGDQLLLSVVNKAYENFESVTLVLPDS